MSNIFNIKPGQTLLKPVFNRADTAAYPTFEEWIVTGVKRKYAEVRQSQSFLTQKIDLETLAPETGGGHSIDRMYVSEEAFREDRYRKKLCGHLVNSVRQIQNNHSNINIAQLHAAMQQLGIDHSAVQP